MTTLLCWVHGKHATHTAELQPLRSFIHFVCIYANEVNQSARNLPGTQERAMFMCMQQDARKEAYRYYQESGRKLTEDVEKLIGNPRGVLVFTPELVVLMKPVLLGEELLWGDLADDPPEANAWYVHLLVGDVQLARRMSDSVPPLEWLCFQRGRRNSLLHVYRWSSLLHRHNNRKEINKQ